MACLYSCKPANLIFINNHFKLWWVLLLFEVLCNRWKSSLSLVDDTL